MKRKLLSLLICLAMLCSLFTAAAAAAGEYPDMPDEGYWSYAALKAAVDNGLLKGREDGTLDPKGTLKRAEMAAIVNRAFGAADADDISGYTDVPLNAWYYGDVAKAVRMGTFRGSGSGLMEPEKPITREQAFTVIARSILLEDGDPAVLEKFTDAGEISDYARGSIAALAAAGYVQGADGKLSPKAYISREAFAQVFHNVLGTYIREAGEYSADVEGNVMVNVPGVVLKNMKIKGDLIVGEGVGSGELTLDGAEVTGRLVIRGGGAHSVILRNKTTVGSARIGKTGDGGIRLRTEEGCRIEAVYVADGRDDIILDGEFNQIVVDTDAPVILADARVTGLTLKAESADVRLEGETQVSAVLVAETAEGAKLTLEEEAKVASLDSAAENVIISGEGTLESARISGDNTQVNTEGTSLTVAEDVQGVTENEKTVEAGETVVTEKPAAAGETGSGSESGSGTVIPPYIPPADPAVYTVVLEGGTRTSFATLAEAIAEAEKTVYTQTEGEGDEAYTLQYHPRVEMTGTGSVTDLVLPAGYSLRIYGDLTISGSVRLEGDLVDETAKTVTLYSRVIVCAPSGVARTAKGAFGFASDCILQLSAEAPADPEIYNGLFIAPDGEDLYMTVLWADVRVNGDLSLGAFHVMSGEDKLNTLTVPAGVTFTLGFSSSNVNLLVEEGATLNILDSMTMYDGSFLRNSGTLVNHGFIRVEPGSVRTLIRDGEEEVMGSAKACFFENTGILLNGSEEDESATIRISGVADLKLGGTITNFGMLDLTEGEILSETVEMTKTQGEPDVGEDTWGMPEYEDGESWYWKVLSRRTEVIDLVPTKATITKVLENRGKMDIFSVPVTVETGAQFLSNEGDIYMGEWYAWEEDAYTYDEAHLLVKGTFVNGSLTDAGGAYNGSRAWFYQSEGKFTNQGEVVNNGELTLEEVIYTQSAGAKFTTYNSSGTEFRGGSLTVPAGAQFINEGRMRISDEYYGEEAEEPAILTDLSGFADFAGLWQAEGNRTDWCEYAAEVYSLEGYNMAVTAQAARTGNLRYNRMDLGGSWEFKNDATLDGFGSYWIQGLMLSKVTVAQGATLTVARGNTLYMDGGSWYDEEEDKEYVMPNTLEVKGTLVLEPRVQLNEHDWSDCGRVEVWTNGSFLCETGTVVCSDADFLIQYREKETWDETTEEMVGTGTLYRHVDCRIVGEPQDALYEADVRTYAGFKAALASADPIFTKISVRDNRDFTITDDLTIPRGVEVYIQPSSGFELAAGKTLTLEGELRCGGDASLYGNLFIAETGAYYNEQHLEVGDVTGGGTAVVTVAGRLVSGDDNLTLRATGSLVLQPGGWMEGVTFNAPLTLKSAAGAEAKYTLPGCTFNEDVILEYTDGDGRLIVDFGDTAKFAQGKKVVVRAAGDIANLDRVTDAVELRGARGLTVQAEMSARVGSGAVGSFTLNGVKAELRSLDGQEYGEGSSVQFRKEGENGNVFQADGCNSRSLHITGDLSGFDELRIMQGCVYAVGLDARPREITICGMWEETNVTLGAYEAVVSAQRNNEGGFSGINITAAAGANLLLKDSWMEWGGDNYCGSFITVNGYQIDPHIFGCRTESTHGGVYIGIKDSAVTYDPISGEEHLQFSFGGDTGSEVKTHLYKLDNEHTWFTAGPQANPHLDLTVTLPGTVTVTVENIPVKPEWEEPQE